MDKMTTAFGQLSKPSRASRTAQRTSIVKTLLGGKVRLLRHNRNPMLYARAYLQGRYVKIRTMETTIREASQIAEEWYFGLRERIRRGVQLHEPLFADIVRDFLTDSTVKASVSRDSTKLREEVDHS